MNVPNVRHPQTYRIKGVRVQLITHFPLTETQARLLALHAWQTNPAVRKLKPESLVRVPWLGSQEDIAALEAIAVARRSAALGGPRRRR